MKREGLNIELNRGKLWIYPCSGYRHIIINNPYPQNRKADRGGRETKTIIKINSSIKSLTEQRKWLGEHAYTQMIKNSTIHCR